MEKPILYCDCDGVIFDTIDVALGMMREYGCNMDNRHEIDYYFRKIIDWRDVFERAHIINNAIEKLRILSESYDFSDTRILTSLSGNYYEEGLKREIFSEYLPGIKVITVQYGIPKPLVVPNPEKHILVDDEKRNCDRWKNCDGTAILFSRETMNMKKDVVNDLLDIPYTNGYKKLIKTRYF